MNDSLGEKMTVTPIMQIKKGKPVGKGNSGGLSMAFLLAGCVLFILSGYVFLSRENTDYTRMADAAEETRNLVKNVETSFRKATDENAATAKATAAILEDLSTRVKALESKPEPVAKQESMSVKLHEPIRVEMVYTPRPTQPLIPTEKKTDTVGKPLMNRAGIKSKAKEF